MFLRHHPKLVFGNPNPLVRYTEQKRIDAIIDFLQPLRPSDQILAAGCGDGHIENFISTGRITMVDISKQAIRDAKANSHNPPPKKFVLADLEHLPFPKNTFNKIECSEVIEHVYSPTKLLSELHRVLKPSGFLVISFPNEQLINLLKKVFLTLGIFDLFFPNVPPDMTAEWHLRSYHLPAFLHDSSSLWQITGIKRIPFPFLPIRYVVKCSKT